MAFLIKNIQNDDKDPSSDIYIFYAVCMDYLHNFDEDQYFYQLQGDGENYIFVLVFYHFI